MLEALAMRYQHLPRSRPCNSAWAHYSQEGLVGLFKQLPHLGEAREPLSCLQAPERPQ